MTIAATMCSAPVAHALKRKVSLITGSTSGIGLGMEAIHEILRLWVKAVALLRYQ